MIYFVLLVCCLGGLVSSAPQNLYDLDDAESLFEEFMATYNKQYADAEEKDKRFDIFRENLKNINDKNALNAEAVFGIDNFADLTRDEFLRMYTGFIPGGPMPCTPKTFNSSASSRSAPDEFDWRDSNKVTRVKNQKHCGSCWAFSVTGNVEGQYAIKHNELVELSESQMVDCDEVSHGCGGGWMGNAILYLQREGGSMSEQDYPYVPERKQCRFEKNKIKAKVTGCTEYKFSRKNGEEQLRETLHQVGPLSVALDASSLQSYQGGIISNCRSGSVNHAVLLVGYGTENNVPYWLLKNSWAASWGEEGYFRIKRNENACNMMARGSQIVSAIVA